MTDIKTKIQQERATKTKQKTQMRGKVNLEFERIKKAKAGKITTPAKPVTPEQHDAQIGQAFQGEPVDLSRQQTPSGGAPGPAEPEGTSPTEQGPGQPDQEGGPNPFQGTPTEENKTAEEEQKKPEEEKEKEPEKDKEEKKKKEEEDKKKEEEKKDEEEKEKEGEEGKEGEGEKEPEEGKGAEEGAPEEEEPRFGEPAKEEGAADTAAEAEGAEGAEAAELGEAGEAAGAAEGAEAAGAGEAAAGGAAGAEATGAAGAEAAGAAAGAEATGAAAAEAGAATAGTGAAATVGVWGPVIAVGCLIIVLLLAFAGVAAYGFACKLGKCPPQQTGPNAANAQLLVASNKTAIDVAGYNKMYIDPKDVKYLEEGVIDRRLVDSLNYLSSKHKYLKISHLLTAYENMTVNPEANQLSANISAHHDGLAGDITTIDFVYKVFAWDATCSAATNGLMGDTVYYNDKNDELLRFECNGDIFDMASANTTWNSMPAVGIPIEITYQDAKPNNPHAGDLPDPGLNLTGADKQVYDSVLQPEARRKVHQVIQELLEYPATTGDVNFNRVTQLITYSQARDVLPFVNDGTLDNIYGKNHPANYGLFAMEEAWQNIHIGY